MTDDVKTFTVGTFWYPDTMPSKRAAAYTLWYDPNCKGCIEYTITATTGAEAKKIACQMRREHEEKKEPAQ